MWRHNNIYWLSAILIVMVAIGLAGTKLLAQQQQELVVTIEPLSSSDKLLHFARAEDFRKQMKFREAIAEYEQVIAPGEVNDKESEAHYDIGLCYTWLMELQQAREIFQQVSQNYPKEDVSSAAAVFGLAWIDTQQKKFQSAIDRLQQKLAENSCPDSALCAEMQFHVGRIYAKYLQNTEAAELAFLQVLLRYPNAEIASHPFLDKWRNSPSDSKKSGTILAPPIIVDVIGIKFDYDHSSNTYDAVDITVNSATDISVPEWANVGQTNEKIAYIKQQGNRRIQAKFYCNQIGTFLIHANVLDGTGIGNLPQTNVTFDASHYSSYITFTANGSVPSSVGIRSFRWDWYVYYSSQTWWVETTGYHTYYALLATPQSPMSEPWTEVLDYACDWASGQSGSTGVAREVTEGIYYNLGDQDGDIDYDWPLGRCIYSKGDGNRTFELTNFLSAINSSSSVIVNCSDCGNIVNIFTAAVGISSQNKRIGNPNTFDTKSINPIGSPGWNTTSWVYHQYGWISSKVYDGCIEVNYGAPILPTDMTQGTYDSYLLAPGESYTWSDTGNASIE